MSDQKHSPIGASSAYRWMACPGSVRLSQGMPNDSSLYAREGTAAHQVAEECLRTGDSPESLLDRIITVEGSEITVDDEMLEAVNVYLNAIQSDRQVNDEMTVEQQFDLSHFFPELYGTNDCSLYRPSTGELIVYDLKYGRGVPVEVERNPQLLYYGLGAATAVPGRKLTAVELVVVQPRCPHAGGPVRRWRLDAVDLLEWSVDLVTAAEMTTRDDAPFQAGDHCKFCPATAICSALREHVLATAQAEFSEDGEPTVPKPEMLSEETMGRALHEASTIENWIRSVREFAHCEAESGRIPSGFKLVAKRAQRKWRDPNEAEQLLKKLRLTKADSHQGKLRSPAQIEKILKKQKATPERMDQFRSQVVKTSTGSTLVEASDKRPALRPQAQEEFTPAGDVASPA